MSAALTHLGQLYKSFQYVQTFCVQAVIVNQSSRRLLLSFLDYNSQIQVSSVTLHFIRMIIYEVLSLE